ncbi:MAG: type ISP restriction/modification enzyme [Pyrinomonadaceae bacterium]
MNALKDYLSHVSLIRRSAAGVKETSYYGSLEALFNDVGKTVKPRVRCVINLANTGAGIPDGGFFTPGQFQRSSNDLIEGQLPERGAIEIKGTSETVDFTADSVQVAKYLNKYRQVLVTNCRDFLLITLDESNQPKRLERYSIADDEKSFWEKADGHRDVTDLENERFVEFLKRVMLHRATLAKPEDVAWFLASYARDAKARIEQSELSALATIRTALEESLGIKFDGEKGEHFLRSTLVQTLFYGIFSAWVLWHKRKGEPPASAGGPVAQSSLTPPAYAGGSPFQWRTASWELGVPMITVLFEQIATATNLKQLNLVEVLDWTENVLNRVHRPEFFAKFAEEHAVQYFYEPFLQAFDPELRKELGVWYTPEEIVRYMVERVDRVLREELNLADGLADESVYVLDPACGTGAYLVEVLKRINHTLEEKGEDATRGQKLKRAVIQRVFGFEILPAPFVVSHLQIGLLLEQLGVGFSDDKKERAGVYLTNSLTGWDEHPKKHLPYPEFEQERDAADKIKKESRILVILGNPPYNAFAGVAQTEEESVQIDVYKKGLVKEWGIKKFNLDDLYVRFFRLAERKIAEQTGQGIVCYISNFSYLSDPSFVVMRKKFLSEFDRVWVDNLNGDSRETGKTTPLGKPDPSIFSTEQTKTGIRVGTSIGLFVRRPGHVDGGMAEVGYREFWGTRKREELLESLKPLGPLAERKSSAFPGDIEINHAAMPPGAERRHSREVQGATDGEAQLHRSANGEAAESEPGAIATGFRVAGTESKLDEETASPEIVNRFSLTPKEITTDYQSWMSVEELSETSPSLGVLENRKDSLVSIDLAPLKSRTNQYFDKLVTWDEILRLNLGLTKDAARFDAKSARTRILDEDEYSEANFKKVMIRPMDNRWCYHHPKIRPIWNEPRPSYSKQCWKGNFSLVSRRRGFGVPEGSPLFFCSTLGFQHAIHKDAYFTPIRLRIDEGKQTENQDSLFGKAEEITKANLSASARIYLQSLGFSNIDDDAETASLIWYHALAIGYSSEYLNENADGVRQDFPRIPLPANRENLIASAELGRRVAALLDTEKPVAGVTAGSVRPELRTVGVASHIEGKQFQDDDFKVTAGWGHGGKGGVTMPGKGKVERRAMSDTELAASPLAGRKSYAFPSDEINDLAAMPQGSEQRHSRGDDRADDGEAQLHRSANGEAGRTTLDIYLNNHAYWRNVPEPVWNYYIGGYQVIKKWLSYREFELLGRPLNLDEITEVTNMTRRIAALILMEAELNENYQRVKANVYTADSYYAS